MLSHRRALYVLVAAALVVAGAARDITDVAGNIPIDSALQKAEPVSALKEWYQ